MRVLQSPIEESSCCKLRVPHNSSRYVLRGMLVAVLLRERITSTELLQVVLLKP